MGCKCKTLKIKDFYCPARTLLTFVLSKAEKHSCFTLSFRFTFSPSNILPNPLSFSHPIIHLYSPPLTSSRFSFTIGKWRQRNYNHLHASSNLKATKWTRVVEEARKGGGKASNVKRRPRKHTRTQSR